MKFFKFEIRNALIKLKITLNIGQTFCPFIIVEAIVIWSQVPCLWCVKCQCMHNLKMKKILLLLQKEKIYMW